MIKRREFLQIFGMSSLLYVLSPWDYLQAQVPERSSIPKTVQPPRWHHGSRFGCSGLPDSEEDLFYNSDY